MEQYKKNSLTLIGAVAMGTGVMIGAEGQPALGAMALARLADAPRCEASA